jgi:hypothetical protein
MAEKRLGKLLHGGDLVGDGQRRRSASVSSEFLILDAEFDLRWVGESGGFGRSIPTRYLKSNSEGVVAVSKAVVPLPGT